MIRRVPITLKEANALVQKLHRHHVPTLSHRFSIGLERDGQLIGAAICGRPVARKTDQYRVCEVARLVTDGTKNACSALYSACARAADAIGYDKIQTFILKTEPGTSLRAAGWKLDGETPGRDWNVPSRGGRRSDQAMGPRQRWVKILSAGR